MKGENMVKQINIDGGTIPIEVKEEKGVHIITVDGVEWVRTESYMHSTVLFNLMCDHITEYMQYKKI